MCIQNCFWYVLTVILFHKSDHKCFHGRGPLLQIRLYLLVYTELYELKLQKWWHTFFHDISLTSSNQLSLVVFISLFPPITSSKGDIDPLIILAAWLFLSAGHCNAGSGLATACHCYNRMFVQLVFIIIDN